MSIIVSPIPNDEDVRKVGNDFLLTTHGARMIFGPFSTAQQKSLERVRKYIKWMNELYEAPKE